MKKYSSNNKGIGCFGWLGIIILICLAIAIYSYCWIPAIPALIYCIFSKKFAAYKKRNVTICSIVLVTSLIVFAALNSPSELNTITADWGKTTFDISETTEVKITPSPADADINSLELSENNIAELNYSDGKAIITFKEAGEVSLFFTANGDIKSQRITITVTDRAAEQAQKEAAEKVAQEAAAEQAAAEQAAAEQAAAEQAAAEQAAAEQAAAEQAAAEQAAAKQTQQPQEQMVWIPQSGSKYHSNASCSGMNNPTQVTISKAQSLGYEPCKKCY